MWAEGGGLDPGILGDDPDGSAWDRRHHPDLGAGTVFGLILALVAVFLIVQALPTFSADPADITGGEGFGSYIVPIVIGTIIAASIALLIATPLGIGVALVSAIGFGLAAVVLTTTAGQPDFRRIWQLDAPIAIVLLLALAGGYLIAAIALTQDWPAESRPG